MAGGFPLGLELCGGTSGGTDVANARGTQVPANSGVAGTFSAWVQLIASTAADANWLVVQIQYNPSASTDVQVNIGVGASGSEKIIINKLISVNFDSAFNAYNYAFPINIPAGTAISAQSAGDHATSESNVYVCAQLFQSGFVAMDGCAGVDNVGITSNHGTAFTTGSGAKGSYVQLTASTARDYTGFYVVIDPGGGATYAIPYSLIDIAIGAAASEKIIVPDTLFAATGAWAVGSCGVIGPFFIPIPAGTAVSVRGTATGANTLGAMLLAMYQ